MCSRRLQYFGEALIEIENSTTGIEENGADVAEDAEAAAADAHTAPDVPENNTLTAGSADSCSSGLIGMAMNKYPETKTCLAPCHSSCSTLNAIMTAYMTRGGQPAAIKEACARRSALSCLFGHVQPCMGLVNKAKGFGMTIPTSAAQLSSMCSRRLQYFGEALIEIENSTTGIEEKGADVAEDAEAAAADVHTAPDVPENNTLTA